MLFFLELSEFVRALGFFGSDSLIVLSLGLLLWIVHKEKLSILYWILAFYMTVVPFSYGIMSGRQELIIIAFSVALFTFLPYSNISAQLSSRMRGGWFLLLAGGSYFGTYGESIYEHSNFNSLFDSGNAFIYYLLINACVVAFVSKSVLIPACLSIPFLMIQTKSIVGLLVSNFRFFLVALAGGATVVILVGIKFMDRLVWFFEQHGVLYALGAGRIERFSDKAAGEFDGATLLIGTPFFKGGENFEMEFFDLVRDFGVIYTFFLYFTCFYLIKQNAGSAWLKLIFIFLILNMSGHFWNNPLLIIAFIGLIKYANSHSHKYVPGR